MPLTLKSTGGGSVTLDTPSTASAYTLTVPAITGTAVVTGSTATVSQAMLASGVAGNGPAFQTSQNSLQNISTASWTKVLFQAEDYDTNNCYDTSTSRFTPTVAGYYMFTAACRTNVTAAGELLISLYKNGGEFRRGGNLNLQTWALSSYQPIVSALVYMNGTTDYAEAYILQTTGATVQTTPSPQITYFQGFLARSA